MKNRHLTLAAMIALLAVAVVGIFVGKLLATPSAIGPGGVRLDGIIVTFKPAAQTKDIYTVAGAVNGRVFVIDPLSRSAAIDIPRQRNVHDILELIQYVEHFPTVESAIPEMEYKPID
jgi:hypothetical protein